jgi:hypothetical protein
MVLTMLRMRCRCSPYSVVEYASFTLAASFALEGQQSRQPTQVHTTIPIPTRWALAYTRSVVVKAASFTLATTTQQQGFITQQRRLPTAAAP